MSEYEIRNHAAERSFFSGVIVGATGLPFMAAMFAFAAGHWKLGIFFVIAFIALFVWALRRVDGDVDALFVDL